MKNFAIFASFIALVNLPFLTKDNQFSADFVGQDSAEVGELCRFMAEGKIVRWTVLPSTGDCESFGKNNENFVVSFRKPGVYTVISAVYNDGNVVIHTQPVTVGQPDPAPGPQPPAPASPLSDKVRQWADEMSVPQDVRRALAANFEQAVNTASSVEELLRITADLNRGIETELLGELQAYLTSQADAGHLQTLEDHAIVWRAIADGLK